MSKRVLIIDDEENIRQMTRLTLESAGYQVGEAASGMECFAILDGDPAWDVVLLDQKMPVLMGTDVLRRLKVQTPQARVIIMTAFASVELAVEAMKLGAADFVRKPMTPEILRNAVASALGAPQTQCAPAERKTFTMNGFAILRNSDVTTGALSERRFVVRRPDGSEQEVVIEIREEAIRGVERLRGHHQSRQSVLDGRGGTLSQ
ncbi:MAG TPA: response regulator [Pyrinomonadaceae bacterium]|nr:response regulator [Pyrinomonadaceae bacterium]